MSETPPPGKDDLPLALARHVDRVCDRFESAWAAWRSGRRPSVADFLGEARGPERSALLRELVLLDVHYRLAGGEAWRPEEYRTFPEFDPAWLGAASPE